MIKYKNITLKNTLDLTHYFNLLSFFDKACLGINELSHLQTSNTFWGDSFTINVKEYEYSTAKEVGFIKLSNLIEDNKGIINYFYFLPEYRDSKVISIKETYLMIFKYMFEFYKNNKISFAAYSFNENILKIWKNPNLEKIVVQEGFSKQDIKYRYCFYDKYTFSIFRDVYLDLATEQYKHIIDKVIID